MVLPIKNPTKSYWIEGAASPLRDFRSTENLPRKTDVVIIGSGYAGATTAYWLHKVRYILSPPNVSYTKGYSIRKTVPKSLRCSCLRLAIFADLLLVAMVGPFNCHLFLHMTLMMDRRSIETTCVLSLPCVGEAIWD